MIRWIERKIGRFAIPNVTIYLVALLAFFYFATVLNETLPGAAMMLVGAKVFEGEVWRLLTFMVMPPSEHPLFMFFALYLLWIYGSALESQWGAFRYNAYLVMGWLATIVVAFIFPHYPITNGFILGSIFLAFAFLFPDFVLYLFFIIPVKIKWLALITWIFYAILFLGGSWPTRVVILAAVSNYLLFFGAEIVRRIRTGHRRMLMQAATLAERTEPFHRCLVCSRTDRSDPNLEFRYCPDCHGAPCYCEDHIFKHEHRPAPPTDRP